MYATSSGCELIGGKWGSAEGLTGLCTTRLCYYFGNCGHWASPISRCSSIQIGDSISKVVFELGEPDVIQPGRFSWFATKGDSKMFDAQFVDGQLTSIECKKEG